MPVYEYTALNSAGKKIKGIVDADSSGAARQKIRHAGNFPVEIKETSPASKKTVGDTQSFTLFAQRISQQEIHLATRQLATLLGAGIPLVQSLSGVIEQSSNRGLKKIYAQIKDCVNEGNSLTTALAEHPRLFSRIYVNMVRAGEASGSLDIVLDRLAEFGESHQAMKSRIMAALMYPIFMVVIGIIVLFLLVTFIVPNITEVFEDRQQALPLPTVFLINLSDFLSSYWWLVLLILFAAVSLIRLYLRQPKGRRLWDHLLLSAPLFGPLTTKIAAARFGRTLANLLQSGVPLITALNIVKNILNNVLLAETIEHATEELEKGKSLSQILRQSKWFSPMLVHMIAVGEQSGALEKMLEKVADNYEREVEAHVMALTALIEPIMILVMALVVLFIIVSILLPILDMNQLIR